MVGLDRKIVQNQQMRTKYADEPEKFMESEIELFEELHKLRELAAAPELYHDFVKLHGVEKVISVAVLHLYCSIAHSSFPKVHFCNCAQF
jgi:beta-catenin-like protein 1